MMTPISEAEIPALRKRWTNWATSAPSRGFVMRLPLAFSAERGRSKSVLKKRTLLSGSSVCARWQEGEDGPGHGDFGRSCEAIEPEVVEKWWTDNASGLSMLRDLVATASLPHFRRPL